MIEVYPLSTNYLHSSHMQNTSIPPQFSPKFSSFMTLSLDIRSRTSSSKPDPDKASCLWFFKYSSFSTVLLDIKTYKLETSVLPFTRPIYNVWT